MLGLKAMSPLRGIDWSTLIGGFMTKLLQIGSRTGLEIFCLSITVKQDRNIISFRIHTFSTASSTTGKKEYFSPFLVDLSFCQQIQHILSILVIPATHCSQ